jgi:hypothetical protein
MPEIPSRILTRQRIAIDKRDRDIADDLMARTKPSSLKHNPLGKIHTEEGKRIRLMGLILRNRYDHLYVMHDHANPHSKEVVEASRAAYYRAMEYAEILEGKEGVEGYPDPIAEVRFRSIKADGVFELENLETSKIEPVLIKSLPTNPTPDETKLILARRDSIIQFMYEWCLKATSDRSPDYRAEYQPRGATLSHREVADCMSEYQAFLFDPKSQSGLNLHSHPVTYQIIDRLLVAPASDLPFNIEIPY